MIDQAGEILEGEVSTQTDLVSTLADGQEDPTSAELSAPPLPASNTTHKRFSYTGNWRPGRPSLVYICQI